MMSEIKYNQLTNEPTPKVQAAGIGGATASIILWLIGAFTDVQVPAEVGAALATLIAFISAYMTRDSKRAVYDNDLGKD